MKIFSRFRGVRGFITLYNHMLRFRYMITEEAKRRVRILAFWERHGEEATKEAFHVSLRTLYRWQEAIEKAGGKIEGLNPGSKTPKRRKKRVVPDGVEGFIVALRVAHPRIGKEKIQPLLEEAGYKMSVSTVGRILSNLKTQNKLPNPQSLSFQGKTGTFTERVQKRTKKLRRPKGYRVLEADTVIRFVDGLKRYILTGIDTEKRTAFAACYTNHGSASATDFLKKIRRVLPDCPSTLQTDNGSEFALHFERACEEKKITHFYTYPRTPKMNAHVERFNRTLDEEFLRWNRALLRDDVPAFNEKLVDWLIWYNAERPHYALGQVSPLRSTMRSLTSDECHMWWTHTTFEFTMTLQKGTNILHVPVAVEGLERVSDLVRLLGEENVEKVVSKEGS
ncbi:MAG: integrase core domain-containing protein, partial [bacterium]|nr:integrase core domain-containing protein [bacterium]